MNTVGNVTSIGPFHMLHTTLLTMLATSQYNIGVQYPADYEFDETKFDFIIVGAGSAGSVIANRLTEIPQWKVLLIEAGDDPPVESDIPILFATLLGTKYDWNYRTEKSNNSCKAMKDQQCFWPRGKMLGGSSSMNAMLYVRANPLDYDHWASLGNEGWSYEELLPFFKKLENYTVSSDTENHGHDGYVNIEQYEDKVFGSTEKIRKLVIDAAQESGIPFIDDINIKQTVDISSVPGTLKNGERVNAAKAYLSPIKDRPNLYVIKKATVTKILINDNTKCYGVEFHKDGISRKVFSDKEVIVSAGTINSPQLLMLSGIGPKEHLQEIGIDVVKDLNVGSNLQDHVSFFGFPVLVEASPDEEINILDLFYNYLTKKIGLNSIGTLNTLAFIDTTKSNSDFPDIQFHFFNFLAKTTAINDYWFRVGNFSVEEEKLLSDLNSKYHILIIGPTLLRPKSSGKVFLSSKDPFDHPKIHSGYLTDGKDVETLIEAIRFAETFIKADSVQGQFTLLDVSHPDCSILEKYSDGYWKCLIEHFISTVYHPVGTCKIAPKSDPNAVVDSQLKVHGVNGLRVADASIMPSIIGGNTNIPSIMIGVKASSLILKQWIREQNQHEEL